MKEARQKTMNVEGVTHGRNEKQKMKYCEEPSKLMNKQKITIIIEKQIY